MDEREQKEDAQWEHVMENMDLLFAQVRDINTTQQKIAAQFSMSTKVVEQLLIEQQLLTKQIEATGQAVANLTLNQAQNHDKQPGSPTGSEASQDEPQFLRCSHFSADEPHPYRAGNPTGRQYSERFNQCKVQVPKLAFLVFEGKTQGYGRINVKTTLKF